MKKLILFFAASAFTGICSAATHHVTVQNMQFTPQNLPDVKVGDMVVWTFNEIDHTTTSGAACTADDKWDFAPTSIGETYSYTFIAEGPYPYFCEPHCGEGMTGMITVTTGTSGILAENFVVIKTSLQNYPNPFLANTSFSFYAGKPGKGDLEIVTMDGKKITSVNITVVAGQNIVPVALDVPAGTYVARLTIEATLPEYRIIVRQK